MKNKIVLYYRKNKFFIKFFLTAICTSSVLYNLQEITLIWPIMYFPYCLILLLEIYLSLKVLKGESECL